MAEDQSDYRPDPMEYPIGEDANPGGCGLAESATFVLRPSSDAEADMLREIDSIQERLRVGIPQLHRDMDTLLARIRTPGSL